MKKVDLVGFFKKLINGIIKVIKMLISGVGFIPLFLIAIIFMIMLIYILFSVGAGVIKDLLNVPDDGANEYVKDAEFLQSLSESGYDDFLDAKQLMRYYSFEYATLMDAARFLEETGSTKIAKRDQSTINPRNLDRDQWAELVAAYLTGGGSAGGSSEDPFTKIAGEQRAAGLAPQDTPAGTEFDTNASLADLCYFKTENEYTHQNCLMPYLCLTRMDDDLTFFFEIRDIAEEGLYMSKGKTLTQSSVTVGGVTKTLGEWITSVDLRFNEGIGSDGSLSAGLSKEWILAHVFPSSFNNQLNKGNIAAFAKGDARYDEITKSSVDLMEDYDEGNLYYTTTEIEVPYKIPLRILLDRFLPNASLLAAWRHISDDEVLKEKMGNSSGDNLVDTVFRIYSEACLKDETMVSGGIVEVMTNPKAKSGESQPSKKEIKVDASNATTFARFETDVLKSTTFREWRFAAGKSNEDWFVTDALEELQADIGGITVDFSYTWQTPSGHSGGHGSTTFSTDVGTMEGFLGAGYYSEDETKRLIADYMIPDYSIDEGNYVPVGSGTVIRRHDIEGGSSDHTAHDYSRPPVDPDALALGVSRCDQESPNAMMDEPTAARVGWHGTGTSTDAMYGEATLDSNYIEISMKSLGVEPGADFNTIEGVNVPDVDAKARSSQSLLDYCRGQAGTKEIVVDHDPNTGEPIIETAYPVIDVSSIRVTHNMDIDFCVYMPTRVAVSMISQRVVDKTLPNGYFVKDAKYWAADKKFNNTYVINGEYLLEDRERFGYLIPNSNLGTGIVDIESVHDETHPATWRCKLFAPIFASKNELDTGRESDIDLIMSEWEVAADAGVNAADHSIRDLYYLINYSKGLVSGDILDEKSGKVKYKEGFGPLDDDCKPISLNSDGTIDSNIKPLINPGSYTYLYIPDEILKFNPMECEKIFWLDRIITTNDDRIDDETENKMRSRLLTFTWQVVDYDLYSETEGSNHNVESEDSGKHYVYAMWPFGDQMSRLMYAIASNASEEEFDKIQAWGGYSGVHKAADLYGRTISERIFNSVFGKPTGQKEKITFNEFYGYSYNKYTGGTSKVKAKTNGGGVILTDSDGNAYYAGVATSSEPTSTSYLDQEEIMLDTGTQHLYVDTPVTLRLGNKNYTFGGSASAAYGYELYRQALIEGDGNKAEQIVKDKLFKEMQWTEVRAQLPGIVTEVKSNASSGFAVTIKHSGYTPGTENSEFTTSYCHMKRYPLVEVGQYVGAGTVIGYEGTTGKSLGYHLHTSYTFKDAPEPDSPVRYLYPFFTPFYYEEKAQEARDKAGESEFLKSEYWSTVRIVFPYGQVIPEEVLSIIEKNKNHDGIRGITYELAADDIKDNPKGPEGATKSVEAEGDIVKIKNYVPQYPVLTDVNLLATEDDADDLGAVPSNPGHLRSGDRIEWKEDFLTTDQDYFDNEFIKKVQANEDKIKGVK